MKIILISKCKNIIMDPWRDCNRRYEPHFFDRMFNRYLPQNQVEIALNEGKKIPCSGRKFDGEQDYEVRWRRWILKVTRRPCTIIMQTAYIV